VIVAERLSKRFGALTALDRLDLVVGRGEVFGYLGPNGAGKTTTIRLFLDALRPTDGSVVVLGGAPRDPAISSAASEAAAMGGVRSEWADVRLLRSPLKLFTRR
jgi:ABC-type multidrug transport system ATPase subunit